jgi:hypothetical protein
MHADIIDDVVSAIIVETVDTMPGGLLSFYRDLPGRSPSEHSKCVAATLASLTDDQATELVRTIVDATVFSLLYLMDVSFKNMNISVAFHRGNDSASPADHPLLERYRFKVSPGGILDSRD